MHLICLQVTPAHDPNDFTTGKRHNLEFINVFDDYGCINENGGPFKGQPRFKARAAAMLFCMRRASLQACCHGQL